MKKPKKTGASKRSKAPAKKVRYAVVGLGYIAQIAVLPAFKNAKNCELAALISSDEKKLKELAKKYGVKFTAGYREYEECLKEAQVDAVYIALPNSMHHEYAIRAANAGVHVLCEKPLAVTPEECREMIAAAEANRVKLMTAYRLHFDPANLETLALAQSGKLGDLRFFHSAFSMQVRDRENIRLSEEMAGGPLRDLGIYAINAARTLFQSEPIEVMAMTESKDDARFDDVEEMMTAILRFPKNRLATFTVSFNAESTSYYEIVGEKGKIRMDPAYDYAEPLKRYLTVSEKTKVREYRREDQFAPELISFSDCILNDTEVEPSGQEGLADLQVIHALYDSVRTGQKISLVTRDKAIRPTEKQKMVRPPVKKEKLIHAVDPGSSR